MSVSYMWLSRTVISSLWNNLCNKFQYFTWDFWDSRIVISSLWNNLCNKFQYFTCDFWDCYIKIQWDLMYVDKIAIYAINFSIFKIQWSDVGWLFREYLGKDI